ncbi:response regulator transcription factor [Hyphomicrobium sp.]|uniref:response regulator transcription factor n=1 Tax=Hyphomicrobium sp. TaxID=82 RepID=UPI002E2EEF7A|nr:response regulator transcription factor [Hyphomicrobium sp.]HEX2839660.1 response regulator transcription factor [Hyphomicrobium sp.]
MRILLIEDEALLGEAVATHLRKWHAVDWMQRLDDGAEAIENVAYDLMLLDLNLPDGRGIDLLRSLRQSGKGLPVIVITAHDQVGDRIEGLNSGADDYVVKPFDLGELAARISALQRRSTAMPSPRLKVGELEIETGNRKIWRDGEEIPLTAREWALVDCFVHRLGTIVSKSKLEEALFEFGSEIESNAVEVYISRLRKKLGSDVILTLRGLGYRMER